MHGRKRIVDKYKYTFRNYFIAAEEQNEREKKLTHTNVFLHSLDSDEF